VVLVNNSKKTELIGEGLDALQRSELGKMIKKKRKIEGYNQEYLASKINTSITTISNAENGKNDVSVEKIKKLCNFLEIDISQYPQLLRVENKSRITQQEQFSFVESSLILNELDSAKEKLKKILCLDHLSTCLSTYYQGKFQLKKKNYPKSETLYLECLKLVEKEPEIKKTNIHSACYRDLARIAFKFKNNIIQALDYTKKGLQDFYQNGDRQHIFHNLLFSKAFYLDMLQQKEEALKAIEELWAIRQQIVNLEIELNMYELKAILYFKSEHFQEALKYAKKGLEKAIINESYGRLVELFTTTGNIYASLNDFHLAENYYIQALELKNKDEVIKDEYLFITTYTQLGKLYTSQKKWTDAHKNLENAVLIGEKNSHDIYRLFHAYFALGDLLFEQQLFDKAIEPYKKAFELHKKNGLPLQDNELLVKLTYCYEQTNSEEFHEYKELLYKMSLSSVIGGANMSLHFMPDPPEE
jgi:tetratricopeptide (TPR) repeat protein